MTPSEASLLAKGYLEYGPDGNLRISEKGKSYVIIKEATKEMNLS